MKLLEPSVTKERFALTSSTLRGELEHREQVVGALLEVGGSKALRGKGSKAGQQRYDCSPDQPLLAFLEAQHCLHYFSVPGQHKLPCRQVQQQLTLKLCRESECKQTTAAGHVCPSEWQFLALPGAQRCLRYFPVPG